MRRPGRSRPATKERKDPAFTYALERSRRVGLAVDAGGANHAKYIVPMHGDLRAFYGHACPGYDPPKPPTAAERHEAQEAAQSRKNRVGIAGAAE